MDPLLNLSCCIENKILKGPKVSFPPGEANVGKTLLDCLRKNRNFIGFIDARTNETLTFGKLLDNSCRCALWFRKNQITSGDIITVSSNNCLKSLAPFLAAWYIGATVSPWNSDAPFDDTRHYLSVVKPKIIFVDENKEKVINDAVESDNLNSRIIVLGNHSKFESFPNIMNGNFSPLEMENFECNSVDPEDIAIFSLSSGSTGKRKCIQHTYDGQRLKNFSFRDQFYRDQTNMVICFDSTLSYEYTVRYTNLCIITSSVAILCDEMIPIEICKAIEKYKVQYIPLMSNVMEQVIKANEFTHCNLSSLRHIILAGAKMNSNILQKINSTIPNCVVLDLYGINDIGGISITKHITEECRYFGLRYNVEIKFIDIDGGEILGPNKPGEMYVKTPYMMKGYYRNPKANEEALDPEGWFRSGDYAYYDDDGTIHFVDRLKAMIRYKEHLISAYEIQHFLSNHPDIIDIAIISTPDGDNECPTACVVKASNSKITENDLLKLSSSLGEYKTLGRVFFLEKIPYLHSNKLNRQELMKIIQDHDKKINKM